MRHTAVPTLIAELAQNASVSALALQFRILTATRTNEALKGQWSEVDLAGAVSTVPAERMKVRRDHRIPLSDAALGVLRTLPCFNGNPYLFPGARYGRSLLNMALLQLMRGPGCGVNGSRGDYVPHGFRSSFRDWSSKVSSSPRDVAKMALANAIENKVEAAYRRGDLFTKRAQMMQVWVDFLREVEL
jgi:integrase